MIIDDINFEKLSYNKINELFLKEGEKKSIKVFLNSKRERTKDKTIDDDGSFENEFPPKTEFKFFGKNNESNNSNNTNEEFIYIGCEDGNIKLVKTTNESIFNIFFK